MKIIFAIIILSISVPAFPQQKIILHGSYCLIAICKDGILMGEDSRVSFLDKDSKVKDDNLSSGNLIAYFDGNQKVFAENGFALCYTGRVFIYGKSLNYYAKRLYPLLDSLMKPSDRFFNLLNDIDKSRTGNINELLSESIYMVGYYRGEPYAIGYSKGNVYSSRGGGLIDDSIGVFSKNLKVNPITLTCNKVLPIMVKTIKDASKNPMRHGAVGGPTMVLKISPYNRMEWVLNEPTDPPNDDLQKSIERLKVDSGKVHFVNKKYKRPIDVLLGGKNQTK